MASKIDAQVAQMPYWDHFETAAQACSSYSTGIKVVRWLAQNTDYLMPYYGIIAKQVASDFAAAGKVLALPALVKDVQEVFEFIVGVLLGNTDFSELSTVDVAQFSFGMGRNAIQVAAMLHEGGYLGTVVKATLFKEIRVLLGICASVTAIVKVVNQCQRLQSTCHELGVIEGSIIGFGQVSKKVFEKKKIEAEVASASGMLVQKVATLALDILAIVAVHYAIAVEVPLILSAIVITSSIIALSQKIDAKRIEAHLPQE